MDELIQTYIDRMDDKSTELMRYMEKLEVVFRVFLDRDSAFRPLNVDICYDYIQRCQEVSEDIRKIAYAMSELGKEWFARPVDF